MRRRFITWRLLTSRVGTSRWPPPKHTRCNVSIKSSTTNTCAKRCRNLIAGVPGEDIRVDALWIAKHYEPNVAHVFLRDALNISRRDRAQLLQKVHGVSPTTANQFILRQLTRLRSVRLLPEVVSRQVLRNHRMNIISAHRLGLEPRDLVKHHAN